MKRAQLVILFIALAIFFLVFNNHAIVQLSDEQLEAFRSAKTVRVIVEQSYGEAKGVGLPFQEIAEKLFQYNGLKVVKGETEDCDLTLKIQAKGSAKGSSYSGGARSGYYYTGASLSGLISLEIQGIPAYKSEFKGYREPSKATWPTSSQKKSSGAPFQSVFYKMGSFATKMMYIMGDIYGTTFILKAFKDKDANIAGTATRVFRNIKDPQTVEPLVSALKDESGFVRSNAAIILARIGDPRAIKPLIDALKEEDNIIVRRDIASVLREITGQNLGNDYEAWSKWWQENKDKFKRQPKK